MKVNELRGKIKEYQRDELELLVVEMYKKIPKSMCEEKEIDQLVDDPYYFKEKGKAKNQTKQLPDFSEVENEVRDFIDNAYAHNYLAPNRIIQKKERSRWRFTAKKLIDNVTAYASHPAHSKACANMYEELYKLFSYASGHYVFASDEPFMTLKIEQPDFLKRVILMKKRNAHPDIWISDSLKLILESEVDYHTLTRSLFDTLVSTLENALLREKALDIAKALLKEKRAQVGRVKNANAYYRVEDAINHLVKFIFVIQSLLAENKEAIQFFNKNYLNDPEVKLFILLDLIKERQTVDEWLAVYEDAVKRNIEPRDSLKKNYDYIKRENEFPKHVWMN